MPPGSGVATFQSDDRKTLADFPSHSHPLPLIYRCRFKADKAEGHAGGEKLSLLYKLHHKADNQTMTFLQHPQVGGVPLLSPRCERNTHGTHDHPSQQSQTKEMTETHTHRGKVTKWHTAGIDVRTTTLTMYERRGLRFRWGKISKFSFSEKKRLQRFSASDKRKRRDVRGRVKEIDPSLRTDTLYISIIQRETALGLTRVVISRVQQGSDSNMTRMNELASCPDEPVTRAAGEMIRLSVMIKAFSSFTHILFLFVVLTRCHAVPKHMFS